MKIGLGTFRWPRQLTTKSQEFDAKCCKNLREYSRYIGCIPVPLTVEVKLRYKTFAKKMVNTCLGLSGGGVHLRKADNF